MGMSQQMPIDITSPTTPSEHGSTVSCSQSQPSHSGEYIFRFFFVNSFVLSFIICSYISISFFWFYFT